MGERDRELKAIMFTDIVGFTSLAQENEESALALLEEHRKVLRELLSRHGGHEVKTIGDAFLVEFSSAVLACRCALELQSEMHRRNSRVPERQRVKLRIGVHVGEVVKKENDIYGDAVNVASRIVKVAEAEGVCVTQQVIDQLYGKLEVKTLQLGRQNLKNVRYPLEVYRFVMPWEEEPISEVAMSSKRLAILPLANISPEPRDEYFADGLTDELISTISKISGISVISRTSVMKYKGSSKSVEEIARELRAGSIMEGSVRKSGDRIRITLQLIDSSNDVNLWSESYDRRLEDVFEVQSEVAQKTAEKLRVTLLESEQRRIQKRDTESSLAYVDCLKGRVLLHGRTETAIKGAKELFELALKEDPEYARAYSGLADCHLLLGDYLFAPYPSSLSECRRYAKKALELDPDLAEAHASYANTLFYDYRFTEAEDEFRRAISLNPSYASAHHWYAQLLRTFGRFDEALRELRLAEELDPLSSAITLSIFYSLNNNGLDAEAQARLRKLKELDSEGSLYTEAQMAYNFLKKDWQMARMYLRKMMDADPTDPYLVMDEAYILAATGSREEALTLVERLRQVPDTAGVKCNLIAFVYLGLGDLDECFKWLNLAIDSREVFIGWVREYPFFEPVRKDSRFRGLLLKAGLSG
jgi:adenylate cyclase